MTGKPHRQPLNGGDPARFLKAMTENLVEAA